MLPLLHFHCSAVFYDLDEPADLTIYSLKDIGVISSYGLCPYYGEKKDCIAMRRYIDEFFDMKLRDSVIEQNDVRAYKFKDILTQTLFYKNLEIIKK